MHMNDMVVISTDDLLNRRHAAHEIVGGIGWPGVLHGCLQYEHPG